jgi:yeast amino acid transporter
MQLANLVNAAILVSAWSAAASDIYISSRFLFFLARRGHAPTFLATLTRFPQRLTPRPTPTAVQASPTLPQINITPPAPAMTLHFHRPSEAIEMSAINERNEEGSSDGQGSTHALDQGGDTQALSGQVSKQKRSSEFILPLISVLASSSVGLLAFLSANKGGPAAVRVLGSPHTQAQI